MDGRQTGSNRSYQDLSGRRSKKEVPKLGLARMSFRESGRTRNLLETFSPSRQMLTSIFLSQTAQVRRLCRPGLKSPFEPPVDATLSSVFSTPPTSQQSMRRECINKEHTGRPQALCRYLATPEAPRAREAITSVKRPCERPFCPVVKIWK